VTTLGGVYGTPGTGSWPPPSDAAKRPGRWVGLRSDLRDRLVPRAATDRLTGWLWPLLVTVLAGFLRFDRLRIPSTKVVFDEKYYAHDSYSLLKHGVELGPKFQHGPGVNDFIVHPPLGKWMIAVGEYFFGGPGTRTIDGAIYPADSFGWRFSAALIGTLSVLILCRVVRRMTGSTLLGCVAGLLLTFDGLEFVQSRVSMLDIFLMFWLLCGFACLVADRDWGRRRLAERFEAAGTPYINGPKIGWRPWRIGAALCLGAALATKWDAAFYIALFFLFAVAWDVGARRAAGSQSPFVTAMRYDFLPLLGIFVALVSVIYIASWGGWFATGTGYDRNWAVTNRSHWSLALPRLPLVHWKPSVHIPNAWSNAVPDAIRSWVHYHYDIWHFHTELTAKHPYQSHPFGWLLLERPVSYFYTSPQHGALGCPATITGSCSKEILAIGTPAIWWASIAALVACLWFWIAKADWRAGVSVSVVAVTIFGWAYGDVFHQRTEFLFYMLPSVPFMCIALTLCLGYGIGPPDASPTRRSIGIAAVEAYVIVVAISFFWLYPVLAAKVIPYASWHRRIWFPSWI
jgi:dolichyl-phosphate-mannose-protein mannosyltransferase